MGLLIVNTLPREDPRAQEGIRDRLDARPYEET